MGIGMQELLVILAIILLLFGAKKIPELAKGLGSGIKNFKKAMKEEDEETQAEAKAKEPEKIQKTEPIQTATATKSEEVKPS